MEGSGELIKSGRVVRMRNRLWRIDNVLDGEFTATPIDGRDTYPRRFLSEIEELAEGSLPLPDPARTSDPAEQDLLLRAFRLSLVHGSAPLVGLQRSRAIPTPYQLVPLLLAVGRERVRVLIADDIGVGKTIEMGLVIAELVARGLVRRALFVVPANLREQTRDALSHFLSWRRSLPASPASQESKPQFGVGKKQMPTHRGRSSNSVRREGPGATRTEKPGASAPHARPRTDRRRSAESSAAGSATATAS
jgi:hypothetical protein